MAATPPATDSYLCQGLGFFDLPPELRQMIYTILYSLLDDRLCFALIRLNDVWHVLQRYNRCVVELLNFRQTNKQLHAETPSTHFGKVRFVLVSPCIYGAYNAVDQALKWLHGILYRETACIHEVEFETLDYDTCIRLSKDILGSCM